MKNDHIFTAAQRAREEAPEGGVDWLAGKKHGYCPWCDSKLTPADVFAFSNAHCNCEDWQSTVSEDANRARYAREQQDADDAEERAFRNATQRQREEF